MKQSGIGGSVKRLEDETFLLGQGNFIGDIDLPLQSYGYILRSSHPHAELLSIDISKALKSDGVLLVLTGDDVRGDKLGGIPCAQLQGDGGRLKGYRTHQPILAIDKVRFVGEGIALIVAESLEQAKDAAELIEISYEVKPFVTVLDQAINSDTPLVWPEAKNNVGFQMAMGDAEAVSLAMESAYHVQELSVRNNRLSAVAMEPRATLGDYSLGRFTLHTSCQKPHVARQLLASAIFQKPEEEFRVICPNVGGGFGLKGTLYPEDALVLWAAKKLGRPVKWVGERQESFVSDTHARDQIADAKMAFDKDGNILALEVDIITNLGSYLSISALVPTARCVMNLSHVYDIPVISVLARSVFTHTAPLGPYRGAGLPEAVNLVERLIDFSAHACDKDAVQLRRQNLIRNSNLPYQTALQYQYDSGDFATVLDKVLQAADWQDFSLRKVETEKRGRLRGFGLGFYIEAITPFNERMEIRLKGNGEVLILAGTFSYGQGHATVYAQMVAEWLGVALDKIHLVQGDTDRVSMGRGSFGSRSITMGGSALKNAVDIVIEKGIKIAAQVLEATEQDILFSNGLFKVTGTDRSIDLISVAQKSFAPLGLPSGTGIGLEGTGYFDGPFNFPNGCHVCEVEVDPSTGLIELKKYMAIDDVGTVVNPLLARGQIHGGIAQGVGQALQENMIYDNSTGQLVSGSLMDYSVPRAKDLPDFQVDFHEVPTETNPLGVKGAGENGCLPAPPAILNAILDALAPLGVRDIDMPATPEKVWRAIRRSSSRK